jgi:glycosyltransferase involved in cell wall biosynthesis
MKACSWPERHVYSCCRRAGCARGAIRPRASSNLVRQDQDRRTVADVRISVITPTRNRASTFLPDCIASVASQRLPDSWQLEHIICDDASDPAERLALAQLAAEHSHIRVVYRTTAGGVAAARNEAFLASLGEVVADLDDDDMLPAFALHRRVSHLLEAGTGWSCGDLLRVDETGHYLVGQDSSANPNEVFPGTQEGFIQGLLDGVLIAWTGTRTYLRDTLVTAGPWDESFPVAEDLEHWLRLTALVGAPAWYPAPASIFREKQRSLGIDALRDGSMQRHVDRARERYRSWPDLPRGLPNWEHRQRAEMMDCHRCGKAVSAVHCQVCGERNILA